ncbi:hypothetical protein MTP99_013021 [Tenebrio molitor]|nr:hypothetical protein MTP99_013021 [Tenebrio molitor]CAH1371586.1 unnamed protein product [Tenebrio molitor]
MKSAVVLFCASLIFFLIISSDADHIRCGKNEQVKDQGIDCQTCTNYQYVRCASINKRQCFCKDGYVRRDDNNECTAISDCPK